MFGRKIGHIADPASFRDPSGFVFMRGNDLFRQINSCYQKQYEALMQSGLYENLTKEHLLIEHKEVSIDCLKEDFYIWIRPERIPLISYPYEWCFEQLQDAALLTLQIMRMALDKNMILKDASAYNVQFLRGQAIFIDTLSFDVYREDSPWVAYGQFCRHFLAPLFLMAYTDIRLNELLRIYIDGIPIDLTSTLLRGKKSLAVTQHIHWHAKAVTAHGQAGKGKVKTLRISKFNLTAMIESMTRIVEKLSPIRHKTEWGDYYEHTNYNDAAEEAKKRHINEYIQQIKPVVTWDLGANDGTYSCLALHDENSFVAALDLDPGAVSLNYIKAKKSKENLLPLIMDLTNPSPGIGFANVERKTLWARQKPDCILMLAVIHHMAISNNIPLGRMAEWLASLTENLIIEFVPKEDSQVKILLATREDIFDEYTQVNFERAFEEYFSLEQKDAVKSSERVLYRMKAKDKGGNIYV